MKQRSKFEASACELGVTPLWHFFHEWFGTEPRVKARPFKWDYQMLRPLLLESQLAISTQDAERRVLALENPGLSGEHLVADALYAGLQLIMPGEVAPPHRHTAAALRFIIEGDGRGYTSVNGQRAYMHPGDFIVTPSWSWHEHRHDGTGPLIWLDVLDVPVARYLATGFSEKLSAEDGSVVDVTSYEHPFAYPYTDATGVLQDQLDGGQLNSHRAAISEYTRSTDEQPAIPTLSTFLQRLPAGFSTAPYRSTASSVMIVANGTGSMLFGDKSNETEFSFAPHDIFAWPSWCPIQVQANSESTIFIASTQATQQKLGLWRESYL